MRPSRLFSAVLFPIFAVAAAAQELPTTPSLYLQGGWSSGSTRSLTLGGTLPWSGWHKSLGNGVLTGYWDMYLSRWGYDDANRNHILLLGVTPTLRWTPDSAHSAWFVEGGIGATLTNHLYQSTDKSFSTAFNFASHLGVGVRWGLHGAHEVVLRLQHISNASIKEPNPGQNFVQLRYALHL